MVNFAFIYTSFLINSVMSAPRARPQGFKTNTRKIILDSVRKGKQVIRDRDRVAPSRTIDNATFVFRWLSTKLKNKDIIVLYFSQSKEPQYEYYYEDQYDSSEPQDDGKEYYYVYFDDNGYEQTYEYYDEYKNDQDESGDYQYYEYKENNNPNLDYYNYS